MAAAIAEPPHLETDLKALCLSTITTQWRPLAEQATRQRQPPADYLAQLVHLEVTGRRERRIQRRIQDARFPMLKTLDAFSFDAQPDVVILPTYRRTSDSWSNGFRRSSPSWSKSRTLRVTTVNRCTNAVAWEIITCSSSSIIRSTLPAGPS